MKRIIDKAIVLRRVNYGESDRILTLLTQEHGKISVFAKGARKQKSKVSAGTELLTVSEIGFIDGKSEMKTLISANIINRYEDVVQNVVKTSQFFEALKKISKIVEDGTGQEFFTLLNEYMQSLNRNDLDTRIVEIWFELHLMRNAGILGSMEVDKSEMLGDVQNYSFNYDEQIFTKNENGDFSENDIKILRLLKSNNKPIILASPIDSLDELLHFVRSLYTTNTP